MKKIPLFILLITALLFAATQFSAVVVAVTDGDTIKVLQEKKEVKVRLYGIDAPEKKQPFGMKSKQFASDFCYGKKVTIVVDNIDFYGRTVAEVFVDGKSLNRAMVENGYAWWYQQYAKKDLDLKRLQEKAEREKRGLWSDKSPQAPWEWRKEQKRLNAEKRAKNSGTKGTNHSSTKKKKKKKR